MTDEDLSKEEVISSAEELKRIAEERREENLEQIEYEQCRKVREVGSAFRETSANTPEEAVEEVTDKLGITEEESRKLLSIYTAIFTEGEGEVAGRASIMGIQYFTGSSIEELADKNDRTIEEAQGDIRAYIGSRLREISLENVDLDQELPANPPNPMAEAMKDFDFDPGLSAMAKAVQPALNFSTESVAKQLSFALPDYNQMVMETLTPVVKPEDLFPDHLFDFSNMFAETLEPLRELGEQYQEIEKSDFEFKWLRDVKFGVFLDLFEVYKQEGNEAAAELLAAQLQDEDDIEDFKEYFATFDEYSERQPIVDEALDAHQEGRYALSIPTLLSQLDGIFIDAAVELGLYTEEDDPTGVTIVAKGEGSPQHIPAIEDDYRSYYASVLWQQRVEILHGKNTDFSDDEILSAKLIWLFFQTLHTVENIRSAEHIGDYYIVQLIREKDDCKEEVVTDELPYQKEYVKDRIQLLEQINVVEECSEGVFKVTEKGIQYLEGNLELEYVESV
ncbi:hypothetical protein [Natronococcus occultus]|uniref:Uncharacterized protein n=1 Tax=Natronococcus occultus SP4 TaxID=694430 RepID=L0JVG4_9EURY|nr:hypothetical protein [Natronococcus occultus]AGB37022.1 hypothetical protein Natoc_1185 [Natronococcus occultus SP4]